MASKSSEAVSESTETREDAPLIDQSVGEVKKMIAQAKEKGFITYEELNRVLPQDQVSSEQIEDVMSLLSEMCESRRENGQRNRSDGLTVAE